MSVGERLLQRNGGAADRTGKREIKENRPTKSLQNARRRFRPQVASPRDPAADTRQNIKELALRKQAHYSLSAYRRKLETRSLAQPSLKDGPKMKGRLWSTHAHSQRL
ncbi:hypothetical protein MTO96_001770 [Rhipicephalus appendiculatus]